MSDRRIKRDIDVARIDCRVGPVRAGFGYRSRSLVGRKEQIAIKLNIDGDKYDIGDDLRSRIEDKIGGLDEYMNSLDRGHVTVAREGGPNGNSIQPCRCRNGTDEVVVGYTRGVSRSG